MRDEREAASHRVCVVDLGTNSFHAVVVDLVPGEVPRVVDKLKITVSLSDGLAQGGLTKMAVERAMAALEEIQLLCERREVGQVRAYATSAIREADNGSDFVEFVHDRLGFRIEPIPGEREAELVWRGVASEVDLAALTLIVDIGGGSTEFVIGNRRRLHHATSLKLGAGRLTQRFFTADPPPETEVDALEAFLDSRLADLMERARELGVKRIVGSSGTMENLCELAHAAGGLEGSAYQTPIPPETMLAFLEDLIASTPEQRAGMPTLDAHRRGQIIAGAVLLRAVVRAIGPESILPSRAAMREGMVAELADDLAVQGPSARVDAERRHFIELGRRLHVDESHAREVARLADLLFQALAPLHELGDRDRALLDRAALVHDVGRIIANRRHHKHGRYIVLQERWPEIHPDEVGIVSMLVRYHRRARPKKRHSQYGALGKKDRRRVRRLAAILRLANALDRSHVGNTRGVQVSIEETSVRVVLDTHGAADLELRAAESCKGAFARAYGKELVIDAAWRGPGSTSA